MLSEVYILQSACLLNKNADTMSFAYAYGPRMVVPLYAVIRDNAGNNLGAILNNWTKLVVSQDASDTHVSK